MNDTTTKTADELYSYIGSLLNACGSPTQCQGCGASIWFLKSKKGKWIPFTRDGLCHFGNCPHAAQFRRKA